MKGAGYSAADLRDVEQALAQILRTEGLPQDSVSDLATTTAACEVHPESLRVDLLLPDGVEVQVTHCGCEASRGPIDAPVNNLSIMALGLAEEIVSYWRSRADTLARLAEFRETCESEAARARSQGIEATFLGLRSPELDTLRGPRRCTEVYFDLIDDSLLPQRWGKTFWDTVEVTEFFRSMRPYLRALAERREELASLGAKGAIDRVAVAAIRHAGLDPLEVIVDMARDNVSRRIAVGGTDVLLYWRFKTIRDEIDVAPGVRGNSGRSASPSNRVTPLNASPTTRSRRWSRHPCFPATPACGAGTTATRRPS